MKSLQTSNTEIRGYVCSTPGLHIQRQKQMAEDAACKHVYEHGRPDAMGVLPIERWMQSLRPGDTAWLPSVLCLVIPRKDRPVGYTPLIGMCSALNRILATGATIVDARAGITSANPKAWAEHVALMGKRVSAGTRHRHERITALRKASESILPGVRARWNSAPMAAKLALQKALWTSAGSIRDARGLLDEELSKCSVRTLYSLLGPRRPNDPKAGGRPPKEERERAPRVRYVYFIQRGRAREVKIGSAYDVESRFSSLRTSSPDDLRLIGALAGDDTTEKTLHKQFEAYWIRREWFKLEGELAEFVKQLPKIKRK